MTWRWIVLLVVIGWPSTAAQRGTFLGPLADSVTEALEDINKAQVCHVPPVHTGAPHTLMCTGSGQPDQHALWCVVVNPQLLKSPKRYVASHDAHRL